MKVFAALSLMAVAASAAEVVQFTSGPPAYVASSLTAHGPVQWAYQQPYYYYQHYDYRQAPATAARYVAVQPARAVVAPVAGLAPVVRVQQRPDPAYTLAYRVRSRVAGDAMNLVETRRGDEASGRYANDTTEPTSSERRRTVQHANEAANTVRADATGRASAAPPKPSRTATTLAVPENKPDKTGY